MVETPLIAVDDTENYNDGHAREAGQCENEPAIFDASIDNVT